jgi:histidine phosphotransferase ChpT
MTTESKLAEMLTTRLCHDLTGPIGAVNNGVEFLGEEGFDMQNEAVQLIFTSAHEAINRLQFYRQAYGRASDTGEACLADKKKITLDFFAATKVKIDWPDSHTDACGIAISQKHSRLLLNLLVIAGASLIRGGTLSVRLQQADDGTKHMQFTAEGETIKLDADIVAIFGRDGASVALSPKTAQPFLTKILADELGATVAFSHSGGKLEILASQRQVVSAGSM